MKQNRDDKPVTIKVLRDEVIKILGDFFITTLAPRFDEIYDKLEEHDKHFEKIDKQLDKIDEHLDKHDRRFDKLDERLDRCHLSSPLN